MLFNYKQKINQCYNINKHKNKKKLSIPTFIIEDENKIIPSFIITYFLASLFTSQILLIDNLILIIILFIISFIANIFSIYYLIITYYITRKINEMFVLEENKKQIIASALINTLLYITLGYFFPIYLMAFFIISVIAFIIIIKW